MYFRVIMLKPTHLPATRQRQRGIVLAMALILLVIISLVGALAIRNSTASEKTVNSLRSNSVAMGAAETGLRYCELVVQGISNGPTALVPATTIAQATPSALVTISDANTSTAVWQTSATWSSSTIVITVPTAFYQSQSAEAANGVTLKNAPVCVIQPYFNARVSPSTGWVVTARGFGNDAQINASKAVTEGSEVWLQSILIP
jgi:type IV pilus assembly protein PilX